jgi:large subunit ribosomal protein L15
MRLHDLKNVPGARKARKRVGRGESSGSGKTSGRGAKGQGSRAGSHWRPTFEGGQMPLIRRMPKVGFTPPTRVAHLAVNVGDLAAFDAGATVDVAALRAAGLVRGPAHTRVKVLGTGDLAVKLAVHAHAFSAAARTKIEAAGGTCETIA